MTRDVEKGSEEEEQEGIHKSVSGGASSGYSPEEGLLL
jgi:hypothetical protein